ncbi:MAG: DUF6817 domain-containing protein [Pseudomonadota bacterium]
MQTAFDEAVTFLRSVGAMDRRHSGRRLDQHLIGTYEILKRWEVADHIAIAGLCHSVFDTKTYTANLDLKRSQLRAVIGGRAEKLVWRFRSIHLFERAIVVRRTPLISKLSDDALAIVLLGAANLMEQMDYMSTRKLGSAPHRYRKIASRFAEVLPQPALSDISTRLGTA